MLSLGGSRQNNNGDVGIHMNLDSIMLQEIMTMATAVITTMQGLTMQTLSPITYQHKPTCSLHQCQVAWPRPIRVAGWGRLCEAQLAGHGSTGQGGPEWVAAGRGGSGRSRVVAPGLDLLLFLFTVKGAQVTTKTCRRRTPTARTPTARHDNEVL